jgi:hypothetical protein
VRLLDDAAVESGVAGGGLAQVLRVQLVELSLDLRVLDTAEVLVVRRLVRVRIHEEHEVPRVREVLEPVREAGLRTGLVVAEGLEVHGAVEDPRARLQADRVQRLRQVLGDRRRRVLVVAVHVDALALGPRLADELAGPVEVRRLARVTVRARLDRLVALHARRQEVARRGQQATEDAGQGPLVDRERDRLTHADVVERLLPVVHEEVVRGVRRLGRVPVRRGLAELAQRVARGRLVDVVDGVALGVLDRPLLVLDHVDLDAVELGGGQVRDLRVARVLLHRERPRAVDLGDHERPDARGRVGRLVLERRVARHDAGERHREDERELAVRLGQVERDRARLVVGLDARDVPARATALEVLVGALDGLVERRAAGLEVEHALDRVLHVAGPDGLAVRVRQAVAERELVGPPAVRGLRDRLGEARDELGARGAALAAVGQERRVRRDERLPPLDRVRQGRIEVVGERPVVEGGLATRLDGGAAALLLGGVARRAGLLVVAAARGHGEDGDEREHEGRQAPQTAGHWCVLPPRGAPGAPVSQ